MSTREWGTAEAHPAIAEGIPRVVLRITGAGHWIGEVVDGEAGQAVSGAIALTPGDARRLRDDLDRALAALDRGRDGPRPVPTPGD
jgi:hypothetical protein